MIKNCVSDAICAILGIKSGVINICSSFQLMPLNKNFHNSYYNLSELILAGLEKISILEEKIPEETLASHLTYVEVHNLQPTHICPLNITYLHSTENLKPDTQQRNRTKNHSRSFNCDLKVDNDASLFKSCTMPEIAKKKKIIENDDDYVSFDGVSSMGRRREYMCVSSILLGRANTPMINVN